MIRKTRLDILARVKAVLRRSDSTLSFPDQVFAYGELKVDFSQAKVTLAGRDVTLTPTEYQILWHLIKATGKVVPIQTLLGRIWGREYLEDASYTHYLKSHIQHLREKLRDQAAAPKYIFTERYAGYRFAKVPA